MCNLRCLSSGHIRSHKTSRGIPQAVFAFSPARGRRGNAMVISAHSAETHFWNGVTSPIMTTLREKSHWLQKKAVLKTHSGKYDDQRPVWTDCIIQISCSHQVIYSSAPYHDFPSFVIARFLSSVIARTGTFNLFTHNLNVSPWEMELA